MADCVISTFLNICFYDLLRILLYQSVYGKVKMVVNFGLLLYNRDPWRGAALSLVTIPYSKGVVYHVQNDCACAARC